ncbi:MAG: OmpA family protein, partial [Saprospiraceae bacterium]|nr:OmpA family protein [Saprospiraceae bacterium]
QVLCYTETPASSRTINVQRLASDASTNTIAVGGQMATYKNKL